MEISKKSWHYRLNKFFTKGYNSVPNSLCPYFWYTILSFLKVIGWAIVCISGGAVATIILFWWLSNLSIVWSSGHIESFLAWFFFGALALGIAHGAAKEWHQDNYKWEYPEDQDACWYRSRTRVQKKPVPWWLIKITLPKITEQPYNPESFSAVAANYIRAWQDKVCPSITFYNPKDKK